MAWGAQNVGSALTGRKSKLPPVEQLAEMLRDGQTAEDIAGIYGVAPTTVDARLRRGGYHQRTGQPHGQAPTDDVSDEADLAALLDRIVPGKWVEDALCSQVDPELFYPEKGGSTAEAKAVCARCEVATECLDYSLDAGERHGIWGGTSERDRRRLARTSQPSTNTQPNHEEVA